MSSHPAVSILVPVYNVERYLAECLDSIVGQTLSDIEVICINDGSTDSSRSILQEYQEKDARIKIIDKPNSGYGASMNRGLKAAHGEYIGIVESDDCIEPNAMQVLYEGAKSADADISRANYWLYWSRPEVRNEIVEIIPPEKDGAVIKPKDEQWIFYQPPSIWSAIYRRSFLLDNDVSFLETPGASYQDTGFAFKAIASSNKMVLSTMPVLHYRQDNESSSINSKGKAYCVCDEYAEMSRYVEKHFNDRSLRLLLQRMKYNTYIWNYERLNGELKLEFIRHMSKEFKNDFVQNGFTISEFTNNWKANALGLIMDCPEAYYASTTDSQNTIFGKLKQYYRIGGLALVAKMVARKVRG